MNHQPTSLKPAEFSRTVYRHAVEKGNDYAEDVLNPNYWVHVQHKLKAGDRIEVVDAEAGYFAELYVASTEYKGKPLVKVCQLFKVATASAATSTEVIEPDDSGEHFVKFRGRAQWSIVRRSDGKVISDGIQTRDDANRELADYTKALAA